MKSVCGFLQRTVYMNLFDTDFHCHILPGIDDGASDIEESVRLINMQMAQGIRNIVATPHFRLHQMSIETFLKRRSAAYQKLMECGLIETMPKIMLSAEIALERNLCYAEGLEQLANQEMNTLLLEIPYEGYRKWMSEEIEEIAFQTKKQIIIAHLDRYVDIFSSADYSDILSIPDVIFQFNTSVFTRMKSRKLLKPLINEDFPIVFGTDCHNSTTRKPNFDLMLKRLKKYEPNYQVMSLFEE